MSPLRVSVINQHPSYAMGGSEVQTSFIANSLTNVGHKVQYVCPTPDGTLNPGPVGLSYELISCTPEAEDIARSVLAFSPDVAYWRYNRRNSLATVRAIQAHGVPVVFAASSIDDLLRWRSPGRRSYRPRGLLALLDHRRNFSTLREAAAVTVNNPSYVAHAPGATYIPNSWHREVQGFSWPRPFVAWVSNLKPPKRPELFVRLAEELSDLDFDFLLAGRASVAYTWITDYQGPASLHYVGELTPDEVSRLLATAALHVHTCGPEGFPNVFIQSWIQGTPSVSFEFDPAGLILEQGLGGCAEGDWSRFVELVRHYLTDGPALRAAGHRASVYADREFSETRSLPPLLSLLQQLSHPSGPA